MLDMFDVMPFDDIDGGAWKQGWDVRYDDKQFDQEPLNVFVVPHSHNDPGIVCFELYSYMQGCLGPSITCMLKANCNVTTTVPFSTYCPIGYHYK